jgi:NADH-quinone oxidoreductase subunit L
VVAIIGTLTAIFAATIGMAQTDIKRVLAYSTVSQLGYMFLACGVGAFSMGIFHLMTHAFFKGLLFLSAGSVIHAVGGEQDMRKMGGLRTKIPVTFLTMSAGTFAIAGFWPLAGFFSKDAILYQAYLSNWVYWAIGLFTAFLTSFYMFRQWLMTFFGEYRGDADTSHGHDDARTGVPATHGHGHGGVHESPAVMLVPLALLAILSVVGGWMGSERFDKFLSPVFHPAATVSAAVPALTEGTPPAGPAEGTKEGPSEKTLAMVSVGIAALGFLVAWFLYHQRPELPDQIAAAAGSLYQPIFNKYWIDDLYAWIFVKPLIAISSVVFWRGIDQGVIDAALDGSAATARELSDEVRHMQSGNLRSYAGWIAVGATAVIAYMVWVGLKP